MQLISKKPINKTTQEQQTQWIIKKKIYTELRETHLQNQSTNNRKPNASRQKCYWFQQNPDREIQKE